MGFRCACLMAGLLLAAPAAAQDARRHEGKTAREWLAALKSEDAATRRRAVGALNALEHRSPQATKAFLALLGQDPDVRVREEVTLFISGVVSGPEDERAAARALGKALTSDAAASVRSGAADAIGILAERAAPAIPSLTAALEDREVSVRRSAASALGAMDARAESAIPALRRIVQDAEQDGMLRQFAASALGFLNPRGATVDVLLAAAKDKSPALRFAAVEALGSPPQGEDARVLPVLIAALKDPVRAVRMGAAGAFRGYGARAASAVPALAAALSEPKVAGIAALSLGRIGAAAEPAVPRLIELLGSADKRLRSSVCAGLRELGPPAAAAAPRLAALLASDPVADVRRAAAAALREVLSKTKQPPEQLLAAVTGDADERTRALGCQALGKIGGAKAEAALVAALADPEPLVRGEAAVGLGLLKRRSASAPLRKALGDPTVRVRSRAAEALGHTADARKPVRRALVRVLDRDPDPWTRYHAALALGRLGKATARVRAALDRALVHKATYTRLGAAAALLRLDPSGRIPAAHMARFLRAREDRVRIRALFLIGDIGPKPEVFREPLIAIARKDPIAAARGAACRALAKTGADARVVVEKVAREDPSYSVREEAAEALKSMR